MDEAHGGTATGEGSCVEGERERNRASHSRENEWVEGKNEVILVGTNIAAQRTVPNLSKRSNLSSHRSPYCQNG